MPFQKVPYYSFGQALTGAVDNFGRQMKYRDAMGLQQGSLLAKQEENRLNREFNDEKFGFEREKHSDAMGLRKSELESLDEYRKGMIAKEKKEKEAKTKGYNGFFPGTSRWAQEAQAVMKYFVEEKGVDPRLAERMTIDKIRERDTKVTSSRDQVTGDVSYNEHPGAPIFAPLPKREEKKGWREQGRFLDQPQAQSQARQEELIYPIPSKTFSEAIGRGTGISTLRGSAQNLANAVSGGLIGQDEAYTEAKNIISNAKLRLNAFMEGDKFSIGEKKLIQDGVEAFETGIFKGPEVMETQLKSLDDYLLQTKREAEFELSQGGRISPTEAQKLSAKIPAIDGIRAYLSGIAPEGTRPSRQLDLSRRENQQPGAGRSKPARSYRKSQAKDVEFDAKIDELLKGLGLE